MEYEKDLGTNSRQGLEQVVKTMQYSHMEAVQMVSQWQGNLGQWYYDISMGRIFVNPLLLLLMGQGLSQHKQFFTIDDLADLLLEEDRLLFIEEFHGCESGHTSLIDFVFRIRDQQGVIHHIYMTGKRAPEYWEVPFIYGDLYDVTQGYLTKREQKKVALGTPLDQTRDRLTGLITQRFFDEHLRKAITLAKAGQQIFSVMAIDIDFFKNVNAHFGREKGDEVLAEVARILTRETRGTDVVSRIAGDRFFLLLIGIDFKVGQNVAERIKKSIANHMFVNGIRITISGGFMSYEQVSKDEIYDSLSRLVNKSKHRGHNVMSYENC